MGLAAASALAAVLITIAVGQAFSTPLALVRAGGQLQFLHATATLACATFMNVGASRARQAPALFLSGSVMVSGSFYAEAAGWDVGVPWVRTVGAAVRAVGWLVSMWSSRQIDRHGVKA